jgi:centromere protein C
MHAACTILLVLMAHCSLRRTGITLREGKRDEYGMEEVDGMFSSPDKSPTKYTFSAGNETIIGSDGMDLDEGS